MTQELCAPALGPAVVFAASDASDASGRCYETRLQIDVYSARDMSTSSRVLQLLIAFGYDLREFVVEEKAVDHQSINGLQDLPFEVMRTRLVVYLKDPAEKDRLQKILNRIVTVLKVIATVSAHGSSLPEELV